MLSQSSPPALKPTGSTPEVSRQRCTFSRKFAPFFGQCRLNFAPLSSTDMQEGLIKNAKKTSVKVASGAGVLRPLPGYILAQQRRVAVTTGNNGG
jgi:hypothetical protein